MNSGSLFSGYETEARFYDYTWSRFVEDIAFYRRRFGVPGRVLDLMCGTGRVALALAQAGWRVDGVDRCSQMLRVARAKVRSLPARARDRVSFHRSELADFRLPGEYDGAVIPVNSFPLILRRRERIRALRNVRRHLGSSAKLLLHVDTPRSYASARTGCPSVEVICLPGSRRLYIRSLSESFLRQDLVRGLTSHLVFERSGRVVSRATTETRTRVLSVPEVVREVRSAGFSPARVFGDYAGGPLTGRSGFAIVEAGV